MFEYLGYVVIKDLMILSGISFGMVAYNDIKKRVQRGK